jgi:hypothetical protein
VTLSQHVGPEASQCDAVSTRGSGGETNVTLSQHVGPEASQCDAVSTLVPEVSPM